MADFTRQILGAIDHQIDERLNSLETAIPGVVSNVRKDGRVDVTPSIRKMVTSGVIDSFDKPILGVPLMQIGFSGLSFDLELSKGDSVLLVFFSRDARQWKKRKWGQSDPQAPLANDGNSCVAIPYVRPDSGAKVVISVDKDGNITFHSPHVVFDSDDVRIKGRLIVEKDILAKDDIFSETGTGVGTSLRNHTHTTAVGPSSPPSPPNPNPNPDLQINDV